MRKSWVLLAAVLACAPAAATTATLEADWAEKPTSEQVWRAYPQMAITLGMEGAATLQCNVTAGGILESCKVISESPLEFGFGAGALSLTPYFRIRPNIRDGRPVASEVRIPIAFKLPLNDAARAPNAPTSPRALELARQLVGRDGFAEVVREVYGVKADMLQYVRTPGAPADARMTAAGAVRSAADNHIAGMQDFLAASLASIFSASELEVVIRAERAAEGAHLFVPGKDRTNVETRLQMEFIRRARAYARTAFCESRRCVPDRDFGAPRQGDPLRKVTIPAPVWIERPTQQQIEDITPQLPVFFGLEGQVEMLCSIGPLGVADTCDVTEETPAGLGFGEAAKQLRGYYRLSPAMRQQKAGDTALVQVKLFRTNEAWPAYTVSTPKDAGRRALARRYVAAIRSGDALRANVEQALLAMAAARLDGVSPDARADAMTAVRKGAERAAKEMDEVAADALASLDDFDLAGAVAFHEGPGGEIWRRHRQEIAMSAAAVFAGFEDVVAADAGRAYCKVRGCAPSTPRAPPPSSSTRRS